MSLSSQARDPEQAAELARIEDAYAHRDRGRSVGGYRFANPGYAFYLQGLEWAVLAGLSRSHIALEGARALDVGCGTGYFLHRLLEFGAAGATGVDLMPNRIEAARRRYPGTRFERADAAACRSPIMSSTSSPSSLVCPRCSTRD